MPYNIAAANSKDYNYASGRLDHQEYDKSVRVIQNLGEEQLLGRVFCAWLTEAFLLPRFFESRPSFDNYVQAMDDPQWFWTPRKHVDPVKEADGQNTCLRNGTTTQSDEYGEKGEDWQRKTRQRIKEIAYIQKIAAEEGVPLELALPEYMRTPTVKEPVDAKTVEDIVVDNQE
jgi:capsid protein